MTKMQTQWEGEAYASASGGQERWALENLDKMNLPTDAIVLDLGCGDGKITAEIARRVFFEGSVIGVDYSASMIRHAQRAHQTANLKFKVADAGALQFSPQFTHVFSNSTLHWVRDHAAVFNGLANATLPGAQLWLSMGGIGTASAFYNAIEELGKQPAWQRWLKGVEHPLTLNPPEAYPAWLESAGFKPKRIELRPRPMVQPDLSSLRGWIETTKRYYIGRIPEASRETFVDEVLKRIEADSEKNEQGQYLMKMVNLEIEATRQ